jgi:hypothetical protein
MDYYYKAGSLVDAGKTDEAIKLIDDLYSKVRNNQFKPGIQHNPGIYGCTWHHLGPDPQVRGTGP